MSWWLLKTSVVINPQKLHRVRMPYKRLFADRLDIVYPRICPDFLRCRVFKQPRLFSSLEIRPSFNLTSLVGGEITARNSCTRVERRIISSLPGPNTAK